jgi:hypothetical protein
VFDLEAFKLSRKVITPTQLIEASEKVNKRLHGQWENSTDLETRENCFQSVKAMQSLIIELMKELGD